MTTSATGQFRSVLVPIDLTPLSDRVLARVGLMRFAEGARVTLLHVVPKRLPPRERRNAERDARKALSRAAASLTGALSNSVSVEPVVRAGTAAAEIARCSGSSSAELVVMGRGGGRVLRDALLGSTAERVIRRSRLPVLVVRLPARTRYSRPMVALDLDQAADGILTSMLRVIPPPRPRIALVHAYDAPFEGMVYPSLLDGEAQEHRRHYKQKALHDLARSLAVALVHLRAKDSEGASLVFKTYLRYGSAREVIKKAVAKGKADLLVLGTHGYSAIAQAFLGTVAGDVLRQVSCDVLVVPPRRNDSSAT